VEDTRGKSPFVRRSLSAAFSSYENKETMVLPDKLTGS